MNNDPALVSLLITVALMVAFFLIVKPVYALYLEALTLPFQAVLIIQFGANFKISELLGLIIVAGWLLRSISSYRTNFRVNRLIGIPALLFILVVILSLINTYINWDIMIQTSLGSVSGLTSGRQSPYTRSFITAAWAVFCGLNMFATAELIRDRRVLLRTINLMLGASAIAAIYAFYKLLFLNLPLPPLLFPGDITHAWARYWVITRSDGTFLEPATMAQYFIVMIPLSLVAWLVKRRTKWAIVLTLQLVALVCTFSPGGWISFSISVLVFLPIALKALRMPVWSTMRSLVGIALALILAVVIVVSISGVDTIAVSRNFWEKVTGSDVGNDTMLRAANLSSGNARIQLSKIALTMWEHNPILGVGIGNYPYLHQYYANIGGINYSKDLTITPSVLYLLILSETGIIGLAVFLLLGWRLITLFLRNGSATNDPILRWLLIGLAGSFIGVAINGLVLDNPFVNYFWLLAGIGLAALRLVIPINKENK